jgi:phosphatidate phosphatase APP1
MPRPPISLKNLNKQINRIVDGLDATADTIRDVGRSVLKSDDPHMIVGYRGFGNASKVLVHGRALEDEGVTPGDVKDPMWRNLLNTYKRLETDPLAGARVRVRFNGVEKELVCDREGFFRHWLELPSAPPGDVAWHGANVELLSPLKEPNAKVETIEQLLVPTASAAFGVISDIDDTVLQSKVANLVQAIQTVVLGNSRTRLPFPGVAAFYEALVRGSGTASGPGGAGNPIFYVSSSPWNLYDVITDFLEIQKIPPGPVMLRDWDIDAGALSSGRHHTHKLAIIREILDTYPKLPFILIGDSTQQDPEIYRTVVGEYPGRILSVYIRNVKAHPERSATIAKLAEEVLAASSTLILADDTLAAAKHAAEKGWISVDALPSIQEEKRADEGKTDEKKGPPAGGETKTAPTVVVSEDPAAHAAKAPLPEP